MITAVDVSLTGNLVLARLLTAGKRAPWPKELRSSLAALFDQPLGEEQWQACLDELVAEGSITVRPYRLTESGRDQALSFLGLTSLPPRTNWKSLQARYLVPMALTIPSTDQETRARISDKDKFLAFLLQQSFDLPASTGPKLNQTLEALVCKELGFPTESSFKGLQEAILNRVFGFTERRSLEAIHNGLPGQLCGARRNDMEGLRNAILRRWLGGAKPIGRSGSESDDVVEANAESPFDLSAFAATVRAAARECPIGRFGDNKVFISHLWRSLQDEPNVPRLDLASFKTHLLEANQARLLSLSRADFVEVMDPADVRESETTHENAKFHFVLIERDRS